MNYATLVERAWRLAGRRRAILGITGSPGAGKTTLARSLAHDLALERPPDGASGGWVAHVPMDGFHLADAELRRLGRLGRKGAPDTFDPIGYQALLRRLRSDIEPVTYAPAFDRRIEQPVAGSIAVDREVRLVITEGNYLLLGGAWAPIRDCLDEVWFCDSDALESQRRLVARHVRFGKSHAEAVAWVREVDADNAALVTRTRSMADLIIGADLLAARCAHP